MAISVDWDTKVITVPKADTSLVDIGPPEIRSLNTDTFRRELKALEADLFQGATYARTHNHTAPLTVGGVTLARSVEIVNGYTVTFENGSYAVNLQGSNNNIGDVLNLNNVQIRSNNSAGLTFSKQTEDQSFEDGRIYIDTINGQSGTAFPLGTPGLPVNNLADAQTIINTRTLPKRLFLKGPLVLASGDSLEDYNVKSDNALLSSINFATTSTATNAVFEGLTIVGDIQGGVRMTGNCILGANTNFEGSMVDSAIAAPVTNILNTDTQNLVGFFNCTSIVAGTGRPTFNCDGVVDLELNVRRYTGGLKITNFNHVSQVASIDIQGRLELDATCTSGTIVVGGHGLLVDNSNGTTVVTTSFIQSEKLDDLWLDGALDIDNPKTYTQTTQQAGSLLKTVHGDPGTSTTVTRTN